jgi:hypothetical protein
VTPAEAAGALALVVVASTLDLVVATCQLTVTVRKVSLTYLWCSSNVWTVVDRLTDVYSESDKVKE